MKKDYFLSVLTLFLVITLSVNFSSCGDDEPDDPRIDPEPPVPTASIKINGLTSTSLIFEGDFNGKSSIDFKQSVAVSSNVEWKMSIDADWLSVSPSNGNGTLQMEIYPTSENESSATRKAIITLSGQDANATISVEQKGKYPVCYVEPANLVALYNQMAFEYSITGDVNTFQMICLSEKECNRLTDREIIAKLEKEEKDKAVDDYISFLVYDSNDNAITSNTTYYICTIAYNEKDKNGELKKTKVTTPSYFNENSDAWVTFDNATYNSGGFKFDVTKRGYCNTYHVIYGNLPSSFIYPSSLYAFEINYYLKNGKKHWYAKNWYLEIKTNYINNDTFIYSTDDLSSYPLIVAYGWGVFKDGTLSSDMNGFRYDTSSSSAPKFNMIRSANDVKRNMTIRRSDVEREKRNIK